MTRIIVLALVLAGCGADTSGPVPFEEHPPGLWFDTRFAQRAGLLSPEQRAEIDRLGVLGYADALYEPPETTGVVICDLKRAQEGLNLYCSGHGAEAFLIDLEGTVVHHWSLPYESLPDAEPPEERVQGAWRRLHLGADGSMLAIYEGLAIAKVDRDSNLVWYRMIPAHHDFDVTGDGHVFVLTRTARWVPWLHAETPVLEDAIEELDADGRTIRSVSLFDALWDSEWRRLLIEAAEKGGHVLHTNTLEILGPEHTVPQPEFRPGRALVCFRELDAVAVVDLDEQRVVWLQKGPWVSPHQPTVDDDGRLLVFDNMGHEGFSRVVGYDVPEREITWSYSTTPPQDFFSIFSGAANRLPDGHVLVTESCQGRAFEITPEGKIVWEFLSPHRAGAHGELTAVLFEMTRIPLDDPSLAWLDSR